MKRLPILALLSVSLLFLLSIVCVRPVWAQATLENPKPNSYQSGLGIISGWVCDASRIEVRFNGGPPVEAAYGTDRGDTQDRCGDADNGFGLLFNWNLLGDGTHTVQVLADGTEFARATVTVTTFRETFLTGTNGEYRVAGFPKVGTDSVVRWQESQQNFVITDGSAGPSGGTGGSPPRVLENPRPGSFQSGLGVISGWVCDAGRIEMRFNGGPPVEAAYGTDRGDTRGVCGDADNGFGLLFNWNLLGDGTHTVQVLADGTEFARATVTVTTFGTAWLRGVSREVTLPDFPEVGIDSVLQWQESQQNFVLTGVRKGRSEGELYWIQERFGLGYQIKKARLDGSRIKVLLSVRDDRTPLGGFAVDEQHRLIYWTEGSYRFGTGRILRANLDGTDRRTITEISEGEHIDIAIDGGRNRIYWTAGASIWRATLDGLAKTEILTLSSGDLRSIALDDVEEKIYYVRTSDSGDWELGQANLDGTQVRRVAIFIPPRTSNGIPKDIALDSVAGRIYWATPRYRAYRSTSHVVSAPLDGRGESGVHVAEEFASVENVAISEHLGGMIYWTSTYGPGAEDIYRRAITPSGTTSAPIERIYSSVGEIHGMVVTPSPSPRLDRTPTPISKMYWINGETSAIQRANLDGSQIENLVWGADPWDIRDIAIDIARDKMYWTTRSGIQRANLDGSRIENLVSLPDHPWDIALDVAGGKMYWAFEEKIERANLDGSQIETLVSRPNYPRDIALDAAGGKMYWTTRSRIERANLDGSQIETLASGTGIPYIVDIALDVAEGKMYWAFEKKIQRVNLGGSQIETLVSLGAAPREIALDVAGDKMYWTTQSGIGRANLDGSSIETLVSGADPWDIALDMAGSNM